MKYTAEIAKRKFLDLLTIFNRQTGDWTRPGDWMLESSSHGLKIVEVTPKGGTQDVFFTNALKPQAFCAACDFAIRAYVIAKNDFSTLNQALSSHAMDSLVN